MNAPYRTFIPTEAERMEEAHAYSRTCNCDACFNAWLAMPEPTDAKREQMARDFSRALAPSGGGELVTDWPKVSFPDLGDADDGLWSKMPGLIDLAKGHRKYNREFGK